jgi:hypothetical protein
MRGVLHHALSAGGSPAQPRHVRFGSRFIDKNESRRVDATPLNPPPCSLLLYVVALLLGRLERLFLSVNFNARRARIIAPLLIVTPNRSFNSRSVASG